MSDMQQAIEALAEALKPETRKVKTNWDRLDVGIEYNGKAITLPGDPTKMPTEKAIEALQRKLRDEHQVFNMHEAFDAYPTDAAVAFVKAMTKLYGWASPQPTPGFFGDDPPSMISIKTGSRDEDVIQCPFGGFTLPGVEGLVRTAVDHNKYVAYGKFMKKDRHILIALAEETRRILREESIYRGKAIRLKVDLDGDLDVNEPPEFLDVTDISESEVLFNEDLMHQINVNLLVPIRYTERCRKEKIPLKRGVLLHGKYGVGKTLLARLVARICEENNWTFILLDRVQGLKQALEFGKRYAPAVVFGEDIDMITGERDDTTNDLTTTIDGVISKGSQVMTVLTTNDVSKIHQVMLRPGRLDAVIHLATPDEKTVQRLVRHYAGGLLKADSDLSRVGKELSGQIPASIRECVERAKLGMIGRGDDKLVEQDIVIAALSMKAHFALLEDKKQEISAEEQLGHSLRKVIKNGDAEALHTIEEKVVAIHNHIF